MPTKTGSEKKEQVFSARNYLLLIIGLIGLICLSLGLILAFGAKYLSSGQTWFLLLFLTFFAFFAVSLVTWLVLRHSGKLAVAQFDHAIQWKTSLPERQKRRLNSEVLDLARALQLSEAQLADLRSAYIVAEDLALRKIQEEVGMPLMRKVSLGNSDFDAVYVDKDLVTCISVTFLVRPVMPQEKVNALLRDTAAARAILSEIRDGSRIRLLLVMVTQLDKKEDSQLRSTIAGSFKSTPVDVDIQIMDFQGLQRLYSDE